MKKKVNYPIYKVANNPLADRQLSDPADEKAEKEAKANTLYDMKVERRDRIAKKLQEIYAGRYGYRKTASGGWRERDEPNEKEMMRQSDAIDKLMKSKQQKQTTPVSPDAARERLKAKGILPIKKKKDND
jgi:hypothetical protein